VQSAVEISEVPALAPIGILYPVEEKASSMNCPINSLLLSSNWYTWEQRLVYTLTESKK